MLADFLNPSSLGRREEFYDRLAEFARNLAIALSTADWVNDPKNERAIKTYKDDLRRFQKLRTAVRKRYQEDIDFKLYEERVRKLLDQHIHANEIVTLSAASSIGSSATTSKMRCGTT
jgi:type I restriction enzyme R subunit